MRTFALLLVLANVAFFFWAAFIDVEPPEPNTVVSNTNNAPMLRLSTERSQAEAASASSARSEAAASLSCVGLGPFANAAAFEQIQKRLVDAGYSVTPQAEEGEVFAGYWVSLSFATRAEAEQALRSLRDRGVTDAYILAEENPPVLSLGLFSEQARAERRRQEIVGLGFQPQLQNRTHRGEIHWLDVMLKEPGESLDPALMQPDTGGIVRLESRPCRSEATASSAASSATSSAESSAPAAPESR